MVTGNEDREAPGTSPGNTHGKPHLDGGEESSDRFASVAESYDALIQWGPRLAKEMPFLLRSLDRLLPEDLRGPTPPKDPAGLVEARGRIRILDVGCGTGAHSLALRSAGYTVTGLDSSAAMLEQARASIHEAGPTLEGSGGERVSNGAKPPSYPVAPSIPEVEWVEGNICDPLILPDRAFDAVLALGNVILTLGNDEEVQRGLEMMVRRVAPGGLLILQYLNTERIRESGRLVVKASGEAKIWLRHHFQAEGALFFHSYVMTKTDGVWEVEVIQGPLPDYPAHRSLSILKPSFREVELREGLTGHPFDPHESDAIGLLASGKMDRVPPD